MTLGQLKKYIESFAPGTVFEYNLSEPFSWRGDYSEVAFSISNEKSTREDLLKKIKSALTGTFYGYKGGEYRFQEYTDIHFEESGSDWTDGRYCAEKLKQVTGVGESTIEATLIKAAFK